MGSCVSTGKWWVDEEPHVLSALAAAKTGLPQALNLSPFFIVYSADHRALVGRSAQSLHFQTRVAHQRGLSLLQPERICTFNEFALESFLLSHRSRGCAFLLNAEDAKDLNEWLTLTLENGGARRLPLASAFVSLFLLQPTAEGTAVFERTVQALGGEALGHNLAEFSLFVQCTLDALRSQVGKRLVLSPLLSAGVRDGTSAAPLP
jgi:hypothetical protein